MNAKYISDMAPQIAILVRNIPVDERIFTGIGELFGVSCVIRQDAGQISEKAAVLVGFNRAEAVAMGDRGIRAIAYVVDGAPALVDGAEVEFGDAAPALFRGTSHRDASLRSAYGLAMEAGDSEVARCGRRTLWMRRGGVDLVAAPFPQLGGDEYLFTRFQPDNWFSLLPLVQFFVECSGWRMPAARACFMFDDPNLHWNSYGYVDFERIAADAAVHNYHVSFATVPLDGWFIHPMTARSFREHRLRLSLLVHGNDHTHHELAQRTTFARRMSVAAQALRRIENIERTARIEIPRVMAPPHGACNEMMAEAMLRTGFDAACVSRSSLQSRNPGVEWPVGIGLPPAEFFAGGLPMIPRFHIQSEIATRARLAAFLGQPVIPMGHHGDLAGGLGLLNGHAAVLNGMCAVEWMNMREIAESNYWTRRRGDVVDVRMYSRRIRLEVPAGVTRLAIDRPWLGRDTSELISVDGAAYSGCEDVAVENGSTIEVRSVYPHATDPATVQTHFVRPAAIARRLLCEARDRLTPVLGSLRDSR